MIYRHDNEGNSHVNVFSKGLLDILKTKKQPPIKHEKTTTGKQE